MIIDLFEKDMKARKRLAELIIIEPDIRLALINAVLRDVATKDDVKALESMVRGEIKSLENRIQELSNIVSELRGSYRELSKRIDDLEVRINDLMKTIDARINDLDKRIDALDKRIDALDKRIDSLDRRIDSLDKRIDLAIKITLILTGSVIATLLTEIISRIIFTR